MKHDSYVDEIISFKEIFLATQALREILKCIKICVIEYFARNGEGVAKQVSTAQLYLKVYVNQCSLSNSSMSKTSSTYNVELNIV